MLRMLSLEVDAFKVYPRKDGDVSIHLSLFSPHNNLHFICMSLTTLLSYHNRKMEICKCILYSKMSLNQVTSNGTQYLTGMLSYLAFLERSSLKFPRRIDNSLDDFTNVKQLVNLLSLQILLTHLLTNTTVWFQFNAFKSFLQP